MIRNWHDRSGDARKKPLFQPEKFLSVVVPRFAAGLAAAGSPTAAFATAGTNGWLLALAGVAAAAGSGVAGRPRSFICLTTASSSCTRCCSSATEAAFASWRMCLGALGTRIVP